MEQHLQDVEEKSCQFRILYLLKVLLQNEGKVNTSSDLQRLRVCHPQILTINTDKTCTSAKRKVNPTGIYVLQNV